MSRDATELPLGSTAGGANRLLAEPAFELLLSEIIAYTGAYVSHTAASRATDVLRASEAGEPEGDELADRVGDSEGSEDEDGGVLVEPSPASVGVGNALLPVSFSANILLLIYEVPGILLSATAVVSGVVAVRRLHKCRSTRNWHYFIEYTWLHRYYSHESGPAAAARALGNRYHFKMCPHACHPRDAVILQLIRSHFRLPQLT